MGDRKPVLALYDFASNQEYIYRTSKIKEITGASILMANKYDDLWNSGKSLDLSMNRKNSISLKYAI